MEDFFNALLLRFKTAFLDNFLEASTLGPLRGCETRTPFCETLPLGFTDKSLKENIGNET